MYNLCSERCEGREVRDSAVRMRSRYGMMLGLTSCSLSLSPLSLHFSLVLCVVLYLLYFRLVAYIHTYPLCLDIVTSTYLSAYLTNTHTRLFTYASNVIHVKLNKIIAIPLLYITGSIYLSSFSHMTIRRLGYCFISLRLT